MPEVNIAKCSYYLSCILFYLLVLNDFGNFNYKLSLLWIWFQLNFNIMWCDECFSVFVRNYVVVSVRLHAWLVNFPFNCNRSSVYQNYYIVPYSNISARAVGLEVPSTPVFKSLGHRFDSGQKRNFLENKILFLEQLAFFIPSSFFLLSSLSRR